MRPVDLVRKLRREAAVKPAALDRGKAALMAAIRQEVQPMRRPTIVPRLPYENVGAALSFLESAFGFREIPAARGVRADGAIDLRLQCRDLRGEFRALRAAASAILARIARGRPIRRDTSSAASGPVLA